MASPSDKPAPPVLKLNRDLFYEVLDLIIPWDPSIARDTGSVPLQDIRRMSHVCHAWRQTILESPALWGRCIDLDYMSHKNWREFVLRMAGPQSLLSISEQRERIRPGASGSTFLVRLLRHHWERIRVLDVTIYMSIVDIDTAWKAFSRPAPNLHIFRVTAQYPDHLVKKPVNFALFSNDAPNLLQLHLTLPHTISATLDLKTSMVFTQNLRSLGLNDPKLSLKDVDLLIACSQMPMLEELDITIQNVSTTSSSENTSIRPKLPHLISIKMHTSTLDVYPAILDHIVPRPGCTLYVEHKLGRDGYSSATEETKRDMDIMKRVIKRYAAPYFKLNSGNPHFCRQLVLKVFPQLGLNFLSSQPHSFGVILETYPFHNDLLIMLIDMISTFEFPASLKVLEFDVMPSFLPSGNLSLIRALQVMHSVKILRIGCDGVSYLGNISTHSDAEVFPDLKVMTLYSLHDDITDNIYSALTSFLESRSRTPPIDILNITKCEWPLGDLRFLDKFSGLRVLWTSEDGAVKEEYTCGTGRKERLLLDYFYGAGYDPDDYM